MWMDLIFMVERPSSRRSSRDHRCGQTPSPRTLRPFESLGSRLILLSTADSLEVGFQTAVGPHLYRPKLVQQSQRLEGKGQHILSSSAEAYEQLRMAGDDLEEVASRTRGKNFSRLLVQ